MSSSCTSAHGTCTARSNFRLTLAKYELLILLNHKHTVFHRTAFYASICYSAGLYLLGTGTTPGSLCYTPDSCVTSSSMFTAHTASLCLTLLRFLVWFRGSLCACRHTTVQTLSVMHPDCSRFQTSSKDFKVSCASILQVCTARQDFVVVLARVGCYCCSINTHQTGNRDTKPA